MTITTLTAVSLLPLLLILTIRIIAYRRGNQISMGDNGDKSLLKRMRAHANFLEYVPLGLLLLALQEWGGQVRWVVTLFALILIVGRYAHAVGFSASPPNFKLRTYGMIATLGYFILSIPALIYVALV